MTASAATDWVWVAAQLALGMIGLSILLAFVRLVKGPSLPDRVVALDLIATLTVAAIATHSILSGEPLYLLVAIVMALIAFLGTVAFAYYVAQGGPE